MDRLQTDGTIPTTPRMTQEALQREADYARAQKILESMRGRGLISLSEFDRITALNRESFSPALAEIMP
ncbi:MAG: hypothetical protein PHU30_07855 [Oscillospiraceae bacterium]|nr:hypothetical protein [Oscillospiraceae bacterium]NLH64541.1 hypothetical protein [Erysipelotrichaceae bacterium]HCB91898.1 hypothetical protein [Oscillospiraceae bacterium]